MVLADVAPHLLVTEISILGPRSLYDGHIAAARVWSRGLVSFVSSLETETPKGSQLARGLPEEVAVAVISDMV
jgi:hypothetical protein